jgi:hypothetical protein
MGARFSSRDLGPATVRKAETTLGSAGLTARATSQPNHGDSEGDLRAGPERRGGGTRLLEARQAARFGELPGRW